MMAGSFLMAMWLFTEGAIMAVYGHAVPGGFQGSSTVTWIVPGSAPSKAVIACSYLFIATCKCTSLGTFVNRCKLTILNT
jgi:hypothetical protein